MLRTLFALSLSGLITMAAMPAVASAHTLPVSAPVEVARQVQTFVTDNDQVLWQRTSTPWMLQSLRTGQERQVLAGLSPDQVVLAGQRAAYTAFTGDFQRSLFLTDLQTGARTEVTGANILLSPALGGDSLFWMQQQGEGSVRRVLRYRINTGVTEEIASLPSDRYVTGANSLIFDGRHVVWTERDPDFGWAVVSALDVTSGRRLMDRLPGEMVGAADGHVLYAVHQRPGGDAMPNTTIYVKNLFTGQDRMLTKAELTGSAMAISGSMAAWKDGNQIILADLATGVQRPVAQGVWQAEQIGFAGQHLLYKSGDVLYAIDLNPPQTQPQPGVPVFHQVRSGDLLWRIAQTRGVNLQHLIRSNNMLNPNVIFPGQQLYLPHPVSPAEESYRVLAGETVATIAARYQTTVNQLERLNPGIRTQLRAGQVIRVTRGPEAVCDAAGKCAQTYAVMPGDSLWKISSQSGVSLSQLAELNQLGPTDQLQVGQTLIIRK